MHVTEEESCDRADEEKPQVPLGVTALHSCNFFPALQWRHPAAQQEAHCPRPAGGGVKPLSGVPHEDSVALVLPEDFYATVLIVFQNSVLNTSFSNKRGFMQLKRYSRN